MGQMVGPKPTQTYFYQKDIVGWYSNGLVGTAMVKYLSVVVWLRNEGMG